MRLAPLLIVCSLAGPLIAGPLTGTWEGRNEDEGCKGEIPIDYIWPCLEETIIRIAFDNNGRVQIYMRLTILDGPIVDLTVNGLYVDEGDVFIVEVTDAFLVIDGEPTEIIEDEPFLDGINRPTVYKVEGDILTIYDPITDITSTAVREPLDLRRVRSTAVERATWGAAKEGSKVRDTEQLQEGTTP